MVKFKNCDSLVYEVEGLVGETHRRVAIGCCIYICLCARVWARAHRYVRICTYVCACAYHWVLALLD